jgi:Spy/CpxP family protein refolding chaperone
MKRILTVMTVALLVAFVSTSVWAGPWGGRFYGMGPALANLTPEQQSKILALQQAHLEKITPLQEELFKKKMELRTLWTAQNPDQTKINALQKEIFDLIEQLQQESTQLRSEILKVIESTPAK